jgi:hypothetical protein
MSSCSGIPELHAGVSCRRVMQGRRTRTSCRNVVHGRHAGSSYRGVVLGRHAGTNSAYYVTEQHALIFITISATVWGTLGQQGQRTTVKNDVNEYRRGVQDGSSLYFLLWRRAGLCRLTIRCSVNCPLYIHITQLLYSHPNIAAHPWSFFYSIWHTHIRTPLPFSRFL